jgi:hypothetical protein
MTFPRPIHIIPVGPAAYNPRLEPIRLPPELGREGNDQ